MRKLSVYAFTTAAAFAAAGAVPMPALAAVNTYSLPGMNGKAIVINGSSLNSSGCPDLGNLNCVIPGFGNIDFDCPDFNLPPIGAPEGNWPGQTLPETPDSETDMDDAVAAVANLVNGERAKAGLAPLAVHAAAATAAQIRAREIASSFSHTRPDGSSFSTALTAEGVNYRSSGENIAYGQTSPQEVMQGWMNSAGHRANILNGSFTSIGVGHYKDAAGVEYWTQMFVQE